MKPGTLWVPLDLARALQGEGLGAEVLDCLRRVRPVRTSSLSLPADRPKAKEHFESFAVVPTLDGPDDILLVDDFVTRGATLIGAASRLHQAFPRSRIRAFAAMRAISNPEEFVAILAPCCGQIRREGENSFRRP